MAKIITPASLASSGTEHGHQAAIFCWANLSGIPELKWLFAIPNGFYATAGQKGKMKAEGLKSGVPDIYLPIPMGSYNGLFIELKTDKGKLSVEQSAWIAFLRGQGYYADICYGWEAARDTILEYLGKK